MEKSLQLTSKLMLHKCSKRNFFWEDRISQLPDDILVIILSFLTMKEAACTSILSHRWKNLWTFITCLDFDACKVLSEIRMRQGMELLELLSAERLKYISWVNQILNSHKGETIDKFRVSFNFHCGFQPYIDKWIEFAIQKRVRWLEVDFQFVESMIAVLEYPFPAQLFGNPNTSFLTALNLNYVDVTRENLEYLLSHHCPCLEILRVSNSPYLFGLKVFGASLKLQYLEITHCPNFIFLEISAVNLTSLIYTGPRIGLRLRNVPNLAVVSFGGDYCERAIYKFSNLFNPIVSQTEMLTLDLDLTQLTLQKFFYLFKTCKFPNLKQLELIMMTNDDDHMLLSCTNFLKACPVLYKFTLELRCFGPLAQKERRTKLECINKLKCLKELELRGFHGRTTDVELAMYLFENASFLEKVTVDTRVGTSQAYVENEYVENGVRLGAKECARQLAREFCPHAELFIL